MSSMAAGPPGLEAITTACSLLYPDQSNPLQVTALVKYWLGGPDPLDYISMYRNPGQPGHEIPPHWHYVTCGFSDLHGDGRVHEPCQPSAQNQPSGFGFELTFRLLSDDHSPPTWPAQLLQAIARYVFASGNTLCVGDHISWHSALDQADSSVQHILLTADSQLKPLKGPLGSVSFIQVVGVTHEELVAAQKWNGVGVLELLTKHSLTGGAWLITNMRRVESVFHVDPTAQVVVEEGVAKEGSQLSGVSAVCGWEDQLGRPGSAFIPGHMTNGDDHVTPTDQSESGLGAAELLHTITLEKVHIKFNIEAANLLPLAIRGRLKHGRHFTFKSFSGDSAITFVGEGVEGALVSEEKPLSSHGPWLQVWVDIHSSDTLLADIEACLAKKDLKLPHTLSWPTLNFTITMATN